MCLGVSSPAFAERVEDAGALDTAGVYWIAATTTATDETTVRVGVVNDSTGMVFISTAPHGNAQIEFPVEDDEGDQWV